MLDKKPVLFGQVRSHPTVVSLPNTYASKHMNRPGPELDEDPEERVLLELLAAFPGFSLQVIASAYTEADCDPNGAAEILTTQHSTSGQGDWESQFTQLNRTPNGYIRDTGGSNYNVNTVGRGGQSADLLLQKYGSGVSDRVARDSQGENAFQMPLLQETLRAPDQNAVAYPHLYAGYGSQHLFHNQVNPSKRPPPTISSEKGSTYEILETGKFLSGPAGIESSTSNLLKENAWTPSPQDVVRHTGDIYTRTLSDASHSKVSAVSGTVSNMIGRSGRADRLHESKGTRTVDNDSGRYTIEGQVEGVKGSSLQAGRNKKKKKKGEGLDFEELEPKDAAQRRAVEDFLYSMLGDGFQLGIYVVRDVLRDCQGDTQKSLDALLQMASSSSGFSNENDNACNGKASLIGDNKLAERVDPLQALIEAFPDIDPAQVVMAFQEHEGNVELVSNALIKTGMRILLDRLKGTFPSVDNTTLFEVLQSNNFSYRDSVEFLMEAGLPPVHERAANQMDPTDRPRTVLQNLYSCNGEAEAPGQPPPLQAVWSNKEPADASSQHDWTVCTSKDIRTDGSAVDKKKALYHFKSYGDWDDYDRHRCSANEHWRTMQYYFREAADAYGRGEHCRAATLSERGKEYKQLAREASERASHRIFNVKNKDIVNNITIDLHAQHVREAIQVLKLHLQTLSSIPSVQTLTVITGHGSHSSDGRARIKPTVTKFLLKREIPWREANAGCLVIKMRDVRTKELESGGYGSAGDSG